MNPTKSELSSLLNSAQNSTMPETGTASDEQLDACLNAIITAFQNLDPDRPVKVKQLTCTNA